MMGHSSFDPEGAAGHRERLRERYRKAGHDGLLDYEKLELLLTFAISRRDVKPIAKVLFSSSQARCTRRAPEEAWRIT